MLNSVPKPLLVWLVPLVLVLVVVVTSLAGPVIAGVLAAAFPFAVAVVILIRRAGRPDDGDQRQVGRMDRFLK